MWKRNVNFNKHNEWNLNQDHSLFYSLIKERLLIIEMIWIKNNKLYVGRSEKSDGIRSHFVGSTLKAGTDSPKQRTQRGDTQHFWFCSTENQTRVMKDHLRTS